MRAAAVRGLSAGDPTAGKALLKALSKAMETESKDNASQIIYAIAKTKDKSLAPQLHPYLGGTQGPDAVAALAMLGDQTVLEHAIKLGSAPDERHNHFAIIAVAALSGTSDKAQKRMVELYDDPSPLIRSATFSWVSS